eukprot:4799763-Prorocentrum_lima.AAC.1
MPRGARLLHGADQPPSLHEVGLGSRELEVIRVDHKGELELRMDERASPIRGCTEARRTEMFFTP